MPTPPVSSTEMTPLFTMVLASEPELSAMALPLRTAMSPSLKALPSGFTPMPLVAEGVVPST